MGRVRKVLLGFVTLLVLLAAGGAGYQWVAARADRERFPPPGELMDVDGLQMHVDCRGRGRPVVILEAGLTSGSWSWGPVHDAVSRHTRVCAYDRPGMGWSTPINREADAGEVADRLHALIRAAGIEGPYVLLGMSAGGVYVRAYYRRHPERVVGMVLVDSSHEQQGNRLPTFEGQESAERMVRLCTLLQPLGVVRLTGALDMLLEQPGIPDASRPLLRAKFNQPGYCRSMLAEIRSFAGDVVDPEPPASLGDLPLVVLSQGNEPAGNEVFGITDEQARIQRAVWNDLQQELTALSTRGTRLVAEQSGHVIQLEQPELVIDSVTDLIASLRQHGTLP